MVRETPRPIALSCHEDRVTRDPGTAAGLFVEFLRLGYLRIRLAHEGHMSAEELARILERASDRILPDEALEWARGPNGPRRAPPVLRRDEWSDAIDEAPRDDRSGRPG